LEIPIDEDLKNLRRNSFNINNYAEQSEILGDKKVEIFDS